MSTTPPNPPEEPNEDARDSDTEREARREEAEALKLEARQDRVKDIEREARIDKLEAGDDLLNEVNHDNSRGDRDDRREKYKPAKVEEGWFTKTARTQRRVLQKIVGSYRPEPDDPVNQKPYAKAIVEGSLFEFHPSAKIRGRDAEATGTIRAAKPAPLPVKPGPAPEPIKGRCWECYRPLRKRDRAGTKFCTDNMGECRKAYNNREADRADLSDLFKKWNDGRHADRMLSIHRAAAVALRDSAAWCGINATFEATTDGVLATHAKPLPPIKPHVLVQLGAPGGGYTMHRVEVIATDDDEGTCFTFEIFSNQAGVSTTIPESSCRPEGMAQLIWLSFEGDRGVSLPKPAQPPPQMSAMYAARNHRVAQYLTDRKRLAG
jgi:hypothetical protein